MIFLYLLLAAVIAALLFFLLRRQAAGFRLQPEKELRFDRLFGILFLCASFFELLLPDLWGQRLTEELFASMKASPGHSFLRLISSALLAVIPVALMYPKKNLARFVSVFGVIGFFLNMASTEVYLGYFLSCPDNFFGDALDPLIYSRVFRLLFFWLMEAFRLMLCIRVFLKRKELLAFHGARDVLGFLLLLPFLLLVNMSPAFPGNFFGTCTGIVLSSMNAVCLLWLLFIILELTALALLFRKRSYEDRYILLLMMGLGLLFRYSNFYRASVPLDAGRFPLQLCNIACYLIPAAIFFKKKGLALFAGTVNAFGALAAVIVCDTPGDSGLFYFLNMHYMLAHGGIIVISLLIFILRIFPAVEKKDYRPVFRVMTAYVATVWVVGTLLNYLAGFVEDPGMLTCNYLFLFRREYISSLLPALDFFFSVGFDIGPYARISLSVVFAYVFLVIISALLFLLYYALFREKKASAAER